MLALESDLRVDEALRVRCWVIRDMGTLPENIASDADFVIIEFKGRDKFRN